MLTSLPTTNPDYFGSQTGVPEADSLIDDLLLALKDTSVKSAISLLYLAIDKLLDATAGDTINQQVKDLIVIN